MEPHRLEAVGETSWLIKETLAEEGPKTMRDIMGMMGKVKEMQAKMEKMQSEIADIRVEGKAGGGLVTVTVNGKGLMLGLKIDPSLFKEDDVEILEDLIVAANKDAQEKAEAIAAEKTRELTAGLPIPPGFKLPF